jgi:hypothetical protein
MTAFYEGHAVVNSSSYIFYHIYTIEFIGRGW